MIKAFLLSRTNTLAVIGLVLVVPAFTIVSFGFMNEIGFPAPDDWLDELIRTNPSVKIAFEMFLHPAVVLGGLALALVCNLVPIFQFKILPGDSSFAAIVSIKNRVLNAFIVLFSLFLSGAIMSYAFFENFQIVPR